MSSLLFTTVPAAGTKPRAWTVVSTQSPASRSFLSAVSCATPKWCVAVGYYEPEPGAAQALVETWDGSSWSIAAAPVPADSALNGVSCATRKWCVESVSTSTLPPTPRGRWSRRGTAACGPSAPVRSPGGKALNRLQSVSCVTRRFCVAAGYYRDDTTADFPFRTLVETWDGMAWRVTTSPTPTGCCDLVILYGVHVPQPNGRVAVGRTSEGATVEVGTGRRGKSLQRLLPCRLAVTPSSACRVRRAGGVSRSARRCQPAVPLGRWSRHGTGACGQVAVSASTANPKDFDVLYGVSCARRGIVCRRRHLRRRRFWIRANADRDLGWEQLDRRRGTKSGHQSHLSLPQRRVMRNTTVVCCCRLLPRAGDTPTVLGRSPSYTVVSKRDGGAPPWHRTARDGVRRDE